MTRLKQLIQWESTWGDKITIGHTTITPQSQALMIRWPNGGFVWNRPIAILVERKGQTERIPIIDVTRLAQLQLWGFALLFAIVIYLSSRKDKTE